MTRKLMWIFLGIFIVLTAYSLSAHYLNLPVAYYFLATSIAPLFGLGAALLHASRRWDWRAALTLFVISFVISLAYESLGVATGLVYGPYHYTEKLGPKFLGLVPYIVPAMWFMMMYPSLVIAERIAPRGDGWKRGLAIAMIGGIVMTAWDVVMDPMMTRVGHWVWEVNGAYFGVPLQNYWGWWLTSFSVFLVNWLAAHRRAVPARDTDDRIIVAVYIVTGLNAILSCLSPDAIQQLGGAALAGFFAMAPWAIVGWIKAKE